MEKTLNMILDKLDSLDQKVNRIDQEQKRQGDLIHQLINTVAATNVKITETNDKMTALETKVDAIEAKVDSLETKVDVIETKVDALETKVDSVIHEVKDIKNAMATKHDLEYYDQMISEHSREIYKLKNR